MAKKARDVLLVADGNIPTTQIILGLLNAIASPAYRIRSVDERVLSMEDFRRLPLVLMSRTCSPDGSPALLHLVKQKYPYLYHLDDDFWSVPAESTLAPLYRDPETRRRLELYVRNASACVVASSRLAEELRSRNPHVRLIDAPVDLDLFHGVAREAHERVRIGFAGSPTRVADAELVARAVERLLAEYPDRIEFEFIGCLPETLKLSADVRFTPPISPYQSFIRHWLARSWDIGLAPLCDTAFNVAKTDNKFREYGAAGIAGVYSAVGPYLTSVKHELTGLLVPNDAQSWHGAIKRLIDETDLRERLARNAKQAVHANHATKVVAERWTHMLDSLAAEIHRQRFRLRAGWWLVRVRDRLYSLLRRALRAR